ncbi:GGDEF domain-containing protein [Frankia sp. AgPm24]|uniref:GGDEF domain-containing protein n=1 Tax=Frankia sp. AgPm24 TaxID=631128 RepID=UPI00200D4CA4|nr:GGDEF domain-containing protein [Frankia sp. AgPm24]MCK9923961.1 GGDEF domain-containing protein [Frankia sp. AgPm24]
MSDGAPSGVLAGSGAGRSPTDRLFRRASASVLVFMLATLLAGVVLPERPGLLLFRCLAVAVYAAGTAVCLVCAARNRGRERHWRLLSAAMLLFLLAVTVIVLRAAVVTDSGLIRLTPASLLFLLPCAFGVASLLTYPTEPFDLAVRGPGPVQDARWYVITILDGVVVAGAATLVAWETILHHMVSIADSHAESIIVGIAVSATTLMLTVVVVLITTFRYAHRQLGLGLLGTAFLAFAVTMNVYLYSASTAQTDVPRLADLGVILPPLLVGLAALSPPDRSTGDGPAAPPGAGHRDDARTASRRRGWHSVLPYLPLLVAGVVTMSMAARGSLHAQYEIWALLGLLVVALIRQLTTMADNIRLLARVEESQRQLRHLAFHDPLTDLANRTLFADRLDHALARWRRHPHRLAVIFCDLNDFKRVNDALGHAAGDDLLRVTARRLAESVRADDTVARLGGDEFAILLEGGTEDFAVIGRRLTEAVRTPVHLADTTYSAAASFGLVIVEPDSAPVSAQDLLHRADLAMYAAKAHGVTSLTTYGPTHPPAPPAPRPPPLTT